MVEIPIDQNLKLRPWRLSDAASLVKYANNRRISINLIDAFPHPYTPADARDYISKQDAHNHGADRALNLAIEQDGEAIGGIGLRPLSDVARLSAEIGYWLGEPLWGKGIATSAVKALCGYGFTSLGLVRIFANVFEWNPASMRVLEKAGFVQEGRLRKAAIKDGKIIDEVLYALVRR